MRLLSSPFASPLSGLIVGLSAGGALALVLATVSPHRADADAPTIETSAVRPGMKGYGLTVFSGTEPEKFDVEVIDVLHKFRPGQDLILVKTIHPRLAKVNVVAGMSGSPIFLDDHGTSKLLGAYAYGWSFGNEPVAGVTPIASMLAEVGRPLSPSLLPHAGKAPLGPTGARATEGETGAASEQQTRFIGAVGHYSLRDHVEQLAAHRRVGTSTTSSPSGASLVAVDTPLMLSGMSDATMREISSLLAPLGVTAMAGGGGGASPTKDAPSHFVDGGGIAVELMRGDSAAQAIGTVTHTLGNKLVAFGHPMMELGPTALPTGIAKILWILSSEQRSFKIGEVARDLGTLIQDRQSCIVTDENIVSPMVPIHLELMGDASAPKKLWSFEVVNDKAMTPMWASFAFGDAIGAAMNDRRDASWTLNATVRLKGHGAVKVEDFGVSGVGLPGPGTFQGSRLGLAVGEILNNPWQEIEVESIDAKLVVDWKRDVVRLRGAELLENEIDPGGSAHVKLTMRAYMGEERTVIATVPIGKELAGHDVELEIIPGWMASPDLAAPETLDQLISVLQSPTLSPKSFVVQYKRTEQGVAIDGKVASRLPGFAVDALRASSSTSVPDAFTPMARTAIDVGAYADGVSRLHLTVRPLSH